MDKKSIIREKYFLKRKKNFFDIIFKFFLHLINFIKKKLIKEKYFLKKKKNFFKIIGKFFLPLIKLIKKRGISKKAFISLYYPSSFEVDVLKILKIEYFKKFNFLLPIIQKNN